MSSNDPMQTLLPPLDQGNFQKPKSSSGLKIVLIILGCLFVGAVMIIGLLIALLYPAVQQVREAARRATTNNQARMLSIGLLSYKDSFQAYPTAAFLDDDGKPLRSWRASILPFIEQANLAEQIQKDKPWNDPANQAVTEMIVPAFSSPRCPDSENSNKTAFVAVVGPDTVITNGKARKDIPDGASSTGWLIELKESDIPWAEPRDVSIEEAISLIQNAKAKGTVVAMADGNAVLIRADTSTEEIRKLFNCSDGAPSVFTLNPRR